MIFRLRLKNNNKIVKEAITFKEIIQGVQRNKFWKITTEVDNTEVTLIENFKKYFCIYAEAEYLLNIDCDIIAKMLVWK